MSEHQKPDTEIGRVLNAADNVARRIVDAEHRADYDDLTGLLNKGAWKRELEKKLEIAKDSSLGVIFIDLKNFKKVNDEKGHVTGDKVLKNTAEVILSVADLLTKNLRTQNNSADLIANEPKYTKGNNGIGRLGGDEFAVIVDLTPRDISTDFKPEDRMSTVMERLEKDFSARDDIASTGVGMSLGGAIWHTGMNASELLSQADAAMYEHKASQGEAYR